MARTAGHVAPRQSRSRETQENLLEAARRLMAERGREAPTVAEIARAAGCSVGGFYARFPGGRDALYELLERRTFETSIECWRAFFSADQRTESALEELLGDLVDLLLRRYGEDGALLRELYLHWRREPPTEGVQAVAERHREVLVGLLADELARRRRALRHPDPAAAARFILDLLRSVLNEQVLFGEGPPEDLRENLVRAVLGVLGAAGPKVGRKEGTP